MGPEDHLIRNEEGGLHLSGRMSLWDIEGLKIVIIQFHLGSFDHLEAQAGKDLNDLIQSLSDRMLFPEGNLPAGKGDIDPFLLQGFPSLPFLNPNQGLFNPRLQCLP